MNCKNCNNPLNENDLFCGSCGTKVETTETTILENNENIDDILLDAYIGKNADKIKEGGFSIPAFLLGSVYLFYRKMWLYGFGYIAIVLISDIFLSSISSFISIVIDVFLGLEFNKLYLKHAKNKINKIKEENFDKPKYLLEDICIKKGGTSALKTFLIIVAYFVILFIIGLAFGTTSDSIENLEYEVSSIFMENPASTDERKIYAVAKDEYACTLNITTTPAYIYEDINEYLDTAFFVTSNLEKTDITKKIIANEFWYTQEVKNNGTIYYYATEKDGYIYYINFDIKRDENDMCSDAKTQLLESLKFN